MGQLEDMQVFIRVVEADGIGRAAEQLGIAKSAVSRRLSEMEKRLGALLINRTTRSSSLTEAGRSYYQQALKVVDQVAEMNSELQDADCAVAGTIRLAVPLSFGLLHLGPAIDLFMQQHPQLSILMDFSDRQVDIVEEGFDLALRIAELGDSSMQARRICPCRHVLAASPDYLERTGVPRTPQDLEQHQALIYSGSSTGQWTVSDTDGKRFSPGLKAAIIANNGDFLLQMACAGHGLVMLPTFIAWKALASGDLVRLLPGCSLPDLNAWFVYPRNRYLPRRVRLLMDFMVERFGDRPYWDQAI
jgi:DNA-binding transcriptional LysR family regulator